MTGFERFGVVPETLVLTSKGHERISTLEGLETDIWTGSSFETTSVFKVNENKKVFRVLTDTGSELICSEDHVFYVQPGYMPDLIVPTEVRSLEIGARLTKSDLFPFTLGGEENFSYSYSHGYYMGAEKYHRRDGSLSRAAIYGARRPILDELEIAHTNKISIFFPSDFPPLWEVPLGVNYSLETKLEWLAGLFDGGLIKRKITPKPIWHLYSSSSDFLNQVKLLIQTLGGDVRVVPNQDMERLPYSLRISGTAIQNLIKLSIPTKQHKFPVIQYKRRGIATPKVLLIEDEFRTSDIYNFVGTEGKGAIFNGLYTASN
jgi:ribonucleoside-diphosphate reductase alpha chain